jgi:hypothetical protein
LGSEQKLVDCDYGNADEGVEVEVTPKLATMTGVAQYCGEDGGGNGDRDGHGNDGDRDGH